MSGVCGNTQFQKHSLLGQQCISVAQAPTGKEAGFTRDGPCIKWQSGDLLPSMLPLSVSQAEQSSYGIAR